MIAGAAAERDKAAMQAMLAELDLESVADTAKHDKKVMRLLELSSPLTFVTATSILLGWRSLHADERECLFFCGLNIC